MSKHPARAIKQIARIPVIYRYVCPDGRTRRRKRSRKIPGAAVARYLEAANQIGAAGRRRSCPKRNDPGFYGIIRH